MKQNMMFSFGKGEEILKERQRMLEEYGEALDEREWCLLIEAYDNAEQYENALSACRKAMQHFPDYWELPFLAGIVCCSMEKYEEALAYFKESGNAGTPFCDEKYRIAWVYRKLERFPEACQIYHEIADIHRKNGYDVEAEQALGYAEEIEKQMKQCI